MTPVWQTSSVDALHHLLEVFDTHRDYRSDSDDILTPPTNFMCILLAKWSQRNDKNFTRNKIGKFAPFAPPNVTVLAGGSA